MFFLCKWGPLGRFLEGRKTHKRHKQVVAHSAGAFAALLSESSTRFPDQGLLSPPMFPRFLLSFYPATKWCHVRTSPRISETNLETHRSWRKKGEMQRWDTVTRLGGREAQWSKRSHVCEELMGVSPFHEKKHHPEQRRASSEQKPMSKPLRLGMV